MLVFKKNYKCIVQNKKKINLMIILIFSYLKLSIFDNYYNLEIKNWNVVFKTEIIIKKNKRQLVECIV